MGFEKGAKSAQIEWHIDFSCSGLAIHRMEVKARCGWEEDKGREAISFTVEGDNRVLCSPELGGMPQFKHVMLLRVYVNIHCKQIIVLLDSASVVARLVRSTEVFLSLSFSFD